MALFNPPPIFCPLVLPLSATALHIAHCAEAEMFSRSVKRRMVKTRNFIGVKVGIMRLLPTIIRRNHQINHRARQAHIQPDRPGNS